MLPATVPGTMAAIMVRTSVARAMSRKPSAHVRRSGAGTAAASTQYCGAGNADGSALAALPVRSDNVATLRLASFTSTLAERWSYW